MIASSPDSTPSVPSEDNASHPERAYSAPLLEDMQGLCPATWFDGKNATAHPARLRPVRSTNERQTSFGLEIFSEQGERLALWPLSAVTVLSGKGEALRLGLTSKGEAGTLAEAHGQRLVVEGEAARVVEAFILPAFRARKKSLLRRWVIGAACVWIAIGLFYLGSPLLFRMTAQLIPIRWEMELGKNSRDAIVQMLSLMDNTYGPSDLGEAQKDLEALKDRLVNATDAKGYSFDLLPLDSSIVNAFALPGGYMVVTTGLIEKCRTPDELAGVLAHEITHVTERHGTSRMLQAQAWGVLARLAGSSESASGKLGEVVVMAVSSGFDRDQEREADLTGARRLRAAGINPQGMADFFGLMAEERKDTHKMFSYLASHPDLRERQAYMLKSAGESQEFSPALSPEAWQRLQKAAKASKSSAAKTTKSDTDKPGAVESSAAAPAAPSGASPNASPDAATPGMTGVNCAEDVKPDTANKTGGADALPKQ